MAESFCCFALQMEVNVKQSLVLVSGGINSLEWDSAVRKVNACLSAQLFLCSNMLYFPKCSCCILTLHLLSPGRRRGHWVDSEWSCIRTQGCWCFSTFIYPAGCQLPSVGLANNFGFVSLGKNIIHNAYLQFNEPRGRGRKKKLLKAQVLIWFCEGRSAPPNRLET